MIYTLDEVAELVKKENGLIDQLKLYGFIEDNLGDHCLTGRCMAHHESGIIVKRPYIMKDSKGRMPISALKTIMLHMPQANPYYEYIYIQPRADVSEDSQRYAFDQLSDTWQGFYWDRARRNTGMYQMQPVILDW